MSQETVGVGRSNAIIRQENKEMSTAADKLASALRKLGVEKLHLVDVIPTDLDMTPRLIAFGVRARKRWAAYKPAAFHGLV